MSLSRSVLYCCTADALLLHAVTAKTLNYLYLWQGVCFACYVLLGDTDVWTYGPNPAFASWYPNLFSTSPHTDHELQCTCYSLSPFQTYTLSHARGKASKSFRRKDKNTDTKLIFSSGLAPTSKILTRMS